MKATKNVWPNPKANRRMHIVIKSYFSNVFPDHHYSNCLRSSAENISIKHNRTSSDWIFLTLLIFSLQVSPPKLQLESWSTVLTRHILSTNGMDVFEETKSAGIYSTVISKNVSKPLQDKPTSSSGIQIVAKNIQTKEQQTNNSLSQFLALVGCSNNTM